jgi:FkbM family methyltransferase
MKDLETKIIAHHVGGRGFGVSFNPPDHFKGDIVHVLYEADSECVDEMNLNFNTPQANLLGERYLFPYCLGRSNGLGRLNITANNYASSMLTPDPSFFEYYCEIQIGPAFYDVTYDDMLKIAKQMDVEVHSLDQLFAKGTLPARTLPDFLSLDTQGLERDILEGAQEVIRQGVLGIVTEVEIAPMYRGQPLLGDMLQLMNTYGFHFAGFTNLHEVSQYRTPIGLRGKAFPGFGDALFLRKIETFNAMGLSRSELFLKATKLAFVSVVFGHIEYALKALNLAASLRTEVQPDLLKQLGARTYFRFLEQIETVAGQVEKLYPPIFGIPNIARLKDFPYPASSWYDTHHEEAVANFYQMTRAISGSTLAMPRPLTWADRFLAHLKYLLNAGSHYSSVPIRDLVLSRPDKAAAKIFYHSVASVRRRVPALASFLGTIARESSQAVMEASKTEEGYSVFESVLIHHGLVAIADTVRQKRITAGRFVRSLGPCSREAGQHGAPSNKN